MPRATAAASSGGSLTTSRQRGQAIRCVREHVARRILVIETREDLERLAEVTRVIEED